jgi:uncharacterized protein
MMRYLFYHSAAVGFAFITLIPVFAALYTLKVNVIDNAQIWTAGLLARNTAINLLFALIISLIEEPLFRGILLVGLNKKFIKPRNSIGICCLVNGGYFLGILRTQVKASLGLCIGCHTCWVWQIKISKRLFNTDFSSEYLQLVSGYNAVIGPLVTAWLVLAIAGYFAYQRIRI